MFLADLCRSITIPWNWILWRFQLQRNSSLGGEDPRDIDTNIEGRHVIVVEDIVDSGFHELYPRISLNHSPASLKICVLLDKPGAHKMEAPFHHVGFQIENDFVVGYGLDYKNLYRNCPISDSERRDLFMKKIQVILALLLWWQPGSRQPEVSGKSASANHSGGACAGFPRSYSGSSLPCSPSP